MSSSFSTEYLSSVLSWKFIGILLLFTLLAATTWRNLVDKVLNIWLCRKYPVTNVETGKPLPTVPYTFPNGQGDTEKFLHGRENSLKWENEYGPMYRIWSGRTPEVVLTQPEHIQQAFKDSDKHIKAVNNNSGYFMGQILGQCVGLISEGEWKGVRAVCERPFLRPAVASHIQVIDRKTQRHFDKLRTHSKLLSESIIDPAQDLKFLPFWIVAEILYGELSPTMEQELEDMVPVREKLFRHVIAGGLSRFEWSKYLPTSANRELEEFKKRWRSFNRRARDGNAHTVSARMYQEVSSGNLSEEQLLQTLDEMLFANLDVTLGGISWNLVFLAAYPEAQARLRAEILSKRQEGTEADDSFSAYLLSSSTYLASCISESSRLRPLAAFSVPQACPTARYIGGYYFPARTNFVVDSHALNQRHAYWGDDPTAFRPERFLEKRGIEDRYHFWRFGFGPRQCLGRYAADAMIRVLLVHLVENYELGPLPDQGKVREEKRDMEVWIETPQTYLRCEGLKEKDTADLENSK